MNLDEWATLAIGRRSKCWSCQTIFSRNDFANYPHDGGWSVDGLRERQWLYFTCPHCKAQNSFASLDIGKG